jgi:hypothetical protein
MFGMKLLTFFLWSSAFVAQTSNLIFSVSEEYELRVRASINTKMKYAHASSDPVAETSFFISETARFSGSNLEMLLGGSRRSIEVKKNKNDNLKDLRQTSGIFTRNSRELVQDHLVKIDHDQHGRGAFEDVVGDKVNNVKINSIDQMEIAIKVPVYLYKSECYTSSDEALRNILDKEY